MCQDPKLLGSKLVLGLVGFLGIPYIVVVAAPMETSAATEVAEQQTIGSVPWIPADNFGARLALIRQHMRWSAEEAAEKCGDLGGQNWRNWETGGTLPRNLTGVCSRIADAAGCDYTWLMVGGPLKPGADGRSRCFSAVDAVHDQLELIDDGGTPWNHRADLVVAS